MRDFIKKPNTKKHLFVFACLVCAILLFWSLNAAYGDLVPETGTINSATKANGYTGDSLDVFMMLAINISDWILGIVGSLALLFFIYGGFTLLISAGNTAQVEKGKKIFGGAVVGLLIVLGSYMIIKFFLGAFGSTPCMRDYALDGYMCMDKSLTSGECILDKGILCPNDSSEDIKCCQR
jgi:hypothetical protein